MLFENINNVWKKPYKNDKLWLSLTKVLRAPMHLYIRTLLLADGMRPHACACIGARLSRDVSRGGFAWYPSSTSNLFVCIGMSLCRLIHARRPCRERHVGCSATPTRGRECTCIFYWRRRAYWFPIAQTRATHDAIRHSRLPPYPSRFDLIYVTQYHLIYF